jgi:hypothetical protein
MKQKITTKGYIKEQYTQDKEMHINPKSFTTLHVQSQNIENVKSFTFLGSIINKDGGTHRKSQCCVHAIVPHLEKQIYILRTKLKLFNCG